MWEWEEIAVAHGRGNASVAARLRCRCRVLSGAARFEQPCGRRVTFAFHLLTLNFFCGSFNSNFNRGELMMIGLLRHVTCQPGIVKSTPADGL